jgi:hypothetical protein
MYAATDHAQIVRARGEASVFCVYFIYNVADPVWVPMSAAHLIFNLLRQMYMCND